VKGVTGRTEAAASTATVAVEMVTAAATLGAVEVLAASLPG
jgi:hypothetical protein